MQNGNRGTSPPTFLLPFGRGRAKGWEWRGAPPLPTHCILESFVTQTHTHTHTQAHTHTQPQA